MEKNKLNVEKLKMGLMPSLLFVKKKHRNYVHNLTSKQTLRLKYHFGRKTFLNLSV